MKQHYAVITGASSGIGAEFARQLAEEGYPLVLVARRTNRLMELAEDLRHIHPNLPIRIFSLDLTRREDCLYLMEAIAELPVSLFINNAGFGDCGSFLETDLEKEETMIDINIRALHRLTKLVLWRFEQQHGGYLLNVASSAGLTPAGPYMATYYATKSYVASLTRAIAQELEERGSKVYAGVLCPGPVDTEFNSVANVEFALAGITARSCVRDAIRGMKQRQTVIIPSLRMKAAIILGRHLPQSLYIRLTGQQQKKKLSPDR